MRGAELDGGNPRLAGADDGIDDGLGLLEGPGRARVGEADEGQRRVVDEGPVVGQELLAEEIAHGGLVADGGGVAVPSGNGEAEEEFRAGEAAGPLERVREGIGDRRAARPPWACKRCAWRRRG